MTEGGARLRAAFRDAGRPLFIPYVMGGYPDAATSLVHARALVPHAGIIELGIPFSDPLADGPTIQAAGQHALDAGTRPSDVLDIARALAGGPPVVVMTYVNILLATGPEAFFERAARAGVAGLIVPDLPFDEATLFREVSARTGVALVPLVAPTTEDSRLAAIDGVADGFVYCVAVTGVTGGEVTVDDELRGFLERVRAAIDLPLAVGFGVRTPGQAAAIGEMADGVVIASQLIRLAGQARDNAAGVAAIEHFAGEVAYALDAVEAGR